MMSSDNNNNSNSRRNDDDSSWWGQAKLYSSPSLPRSTLAMSMMSLLETNGVPYNENYDCDYDDDGHNAEESDYNQTLKGIIVEFKSNTDIIWFACEKFPLWANFILADTSVELRDNEFFMIELSKLFGYDRKKHYNTMRHDTNIISPPFMHASNRLKANQVFVINALTPLFSGDCNDSWDCNNDSSVARRHFEYIVSSSLVSSTPDFLDDVDFVNEAFGWSESVLEYATTDVINNTELWKQLFRNFKNLSYITFQHVPERFWLDVLNNTEFWKQLLKEQYTGAIARHVPERVWDEIRGDPEIMLSAIVDNDLYMDTDLLLNSARVLNDKEFIYQLVQITKCDVVHCYFENHASDYPAFLDDEDVMSAAVSNFAWTFKYASLRLKGVRKLALEAVRKVPSLITEVSSDLRYDKEVALQTVRSDGWAIRYFQNDESPLKNDIVLAVAAEMKMINLPKLDLLSNLKQLPFFLEKATNHPLVMYYILLNKNNLLLPSSPTKNNSRSNKRKRGDN